MPRERNKPAELILDLGTFDNFQKEASRPLLDSGPYHLRISDWEHYVTKKGQHSVYIYHEAIDCDDPDMNGLEVRRLFMLEGDGRGFLAEYFSLLHNPQAGVNISWGESEQVDLRQLFDDIIGLQIDADVAKELYTPEGGGETREVNNVTGFRRRED